MELEDNPLQKPSHFCSPWRAEICSAAGEVEKFHDDVFQRTVRVGVARILVLAIVSLIGNPLPAAEPAIRTRVTLADKATRLGHLSWDTEGGKQDEQNLLRPTGPEEPMLWTCAQGAWKPAGAAARIDYESMGDGFDLVFSPNDHSSRTVDALRAVFHFNTLVSATTLLPDHVDDEGTFHFPLIVCSPGFGQMLVSAPAGVKSRLDGDRDKHLVDWTIDMPLGESAGPIRLTFRPVVLAMPAGFTDEARWKLVRRAWFNVFQMSAQWGQKGNPVSAPAGVLSNNVVSDPVSSCLFIYADSALWTPEVPGGVSLMRLVGHTLDWWLDKRMVDSGAVPGYWNLVSFLDANPSLLITAWDYFEATQDRDWLQARIEKLERAAEYLASRDTDNDGLIEAVQSGNAGTLKEPDRSCSGYDVINCGHKDAYCNALIYRGFRCLAEMEGRIGRIEKQQHYAHLANRLKAGFAKQLFNPETGLIAWWVSQDGKLHDYASPVINGLAIDYGLVDPATASEILKRMDAQFKRAGFKRYDLGMPCTLVPVRREDYLLSTSGYSKKADGSDTFGLYLNGGITTGDAVRYLGALYQAGRAQQADEYLDSQLARIAHGDADQGGFPISIINRYPDGAELWSWEGKPCGYEGMLSHTWHFLQAVALREPALRERIHRPLNPQ